MFEHDLKLVLRLVPIQYLSSHNSLNPDGPQTHPRLAFQTEAIFRARAIRPNTFRHIKTRITLDPAVRPIIAKIAITVTILSNERN